MSYDPRPTFDEKDKELLKVRATKHEQCKGPEVGDFVLMPGEYNPRRFTHDWGDSIQTTVSTEMRANGTTHPCAGDASFYIDRDGECSFSGSLDAAIPKNKIFKKKERTKQGGEEQGKKYGAIWFFHHDQPGAGRGVHCTMMFKVWEYKP